MTDIYAALPAITGKFELEYEGELRGADNVAKDIIRGAVGTVFNGYFANADLRQVTEWFDLGGNLQVDDTLSADELLARARDVQGLRELAMQAGIDRDAPAPLQAVGDRLRARGTLRAEEDQPVGRIPVPVGRTAAAPDAAGRADRAGIEREIPNVAGKKKYYN